MDPFSGQPIWRKPTSTEAFLGPVFACSVFARELQKQPQARSVSSPPHLSTQGHSVSSRRMEAGQSGAACTVPSYIHLANPPHVLWMQRPPTKVPAAHPPEGLCSIFSSVLCKKCLGLGVYGLVESLIVLNLS